MARRLLPVLAAGLAVALLLLAGAAWLVLPRLVETGVRRWARAQGWQEVSLAVTEVAPWRLVIEDLRLGADLSVPRLELVSGPRRLLAGRAERVVLEGARVAGRYGPEGVQVALPPGADDGTPAEPRAGIAPPPFDALVVRDARLVLVGGQGPIAVAVLSLDLSTAGGAPLVAQGRIEARHGERVLEAELDLGLDGDRLVGSARLRDGADTLDADLRLTDPEPGRDVFPTAVAPCALRAEGRLALRADAADLSPLAGRLTASGHADLALADGKLRVRAGAIRAGAPTFLEVEALELDADLARLAAGHAGRVAVRGGTLRGRLGAEGLVFPGLSPAAPGAPDADREESDAGKPAFTAPPVDALSVRDFRVVLETEDAPLTLTVASLALAAPPDARLGLEGTLVLHRVGQQLDAGLDLALDGARLRGRATVAMPGGALDAELDLGAPGEGPGRPPALTSLADLSAEGRLELSAEEADLSPFARALSAEGSLAVALADGGLRVEGEDLELAAFGLRARGVNLRVALEQIAPPRTPAGQRLAVARLTAGLDLGGGAARFRLGRGGVLHLESVDWRAFGGTLHTEGRIDPAETVNRLTVRVAGLSLPALLAEIGREDLTVTGALDGELAVRVEGDRIFADGGRLTAEQGVIRYTPAGGVGGMQGLDLAMRALEDFRYRVLWLEPRGEITGEMTLAIRLEGSNPEVYDGYPIQLNLNLEGPLADVVQGSTTGFRVQDVMDERFQERRETR